MALSRSCVKVSHLPQISLIVVQKRPGYIIISLCYLICSSMTCAVMFKLKKRVKQDSYTPALPITWLLIL